MDNILNFIARSPSDPNGGNGGLGFSTKEAAQLHADRMNCLTEEWDSNIIWNKEFWKTKPEPWIILEK